MVVRRGGAIELVGRDVVIFVARTAAHDIGGARHSGMERLDMAAVTVGVHVARQDEVDAERVEMLHESAADITEACRLAVRLRLVISKDIFMHEDDVPRTSSFFLCRFLRCKVFLHPCNLLGKDARQQAVELAPLRVEHEDMCGAVVERIIVAREARTAIFRHGEAREVALGQAVEPLRAVTFVVAHDGDEDG